jgi:hypothetical protein
MVVCRSAKVATAKLGRLTTYQLNRSGQRIGNPGKEAACRGESRCRPDSPDDGAPASPRPATGSPRRDDAREGRCAGARRVLSAAGAPGIVVIQEWWGLNDQIKGVADRLAKAGYRALVPDLYRGKVTVEAEEAEHLMKGQNFGDAAGQDVRGAVQHLKGKSVKVGVTGFCLGGALTVLSAVHVPEAGAAVIWYGYPPLEYVDPSHRRCGRGPRSSPSRGHRPSRVRPSPGGLAWTRSLAAGAQPHHPVAGAPQRDVRTQSRLP